LAGTGHPNTGSFENQTNLSSFAKLDCFIQKKELYKKWSSLVENLGWVFGMVKNKRTIFEVSVSLDIFSHK
jgi:hypothetical protein